MVDQLLAAVVHASSPPVICNQYPVTATAHCQPMPKWLTKWYRKHHFVPAPRSDGFVPYAGTRPTDIIVRGALIG